MAKTRIPKYRLHKASGQALVQIGGERIYLGKYDSPHSREKYDRLVGDYLLRKREGSPSSKSSRSSKAAITSISINEMLLEYWTFARKYHYDHQRNRPKKELDSIRKALEPLKALFGTSAADDFSPRDLKVVRQNMIETGYARTHINRQINRIRRVFKWAVSEQLIPAGVWQALGTVEPLRNGQSGVKEAPPVQPVDDKDVDAILPFLTPTLQAMVRLQRITGMRPGEVCQMRPCDVDRSREIWLYQPESHKNQWRGHSRVVPLGPKAREILKPFLDREPEEYCFSPVDSEIWRFENRPPYSGRDRKTKVYPSELKRREQQKAESRKRRLKTRTTRRYDAGSYQQALGYAFDRAEKEREEKPKAKRGKQITRWSPNQLRHTRATELRSQYGIEAAQLILGHANADVTEVYAERDLKKAIEIARETG